MSKPAQTAERRRKERVDIRLPIRLRWYGPIIPLLETTQTLDVSRAGLLVLRRDPCRIKARLWVRFPFNPDALLTQPETLARVAHVKAVPQSGYLVGLAFEGSAAAYVAGAGHADRRGMQRLTLALPVRARKHEIRWPEETMTADVSDRGIRFHTSRFYLPGDAVRVALTYRYDSWCSAEELPGRVVRVDPVPDSMLDSVAVSLVPSVPAGGAVPSHRDH